MYSDIKGISILKHITKIKFKLKKYVVISIKYLIVYILLLCGGQTFSKSLIIASLSAAFDSFIKNMI